MKNIRQKLKFKGFINTYIREKQHDLNILDKLVVMALNQPPVTLSTFNLLFCYYFVPRTDHLIRLGKVLLIFNVRSFVLMLCCFFCQLLNSFNNFLICQRRIVLKHQILYLPVNYCPPSVVSNQWQKKEKSVHVPFFTDESVAPRGGAFLDCPLLDKKDFTTKKCVHVLI